MVHRSRCLIKEKIAFESNRMLRGLVNWCDNIRQRKYWAQGREEGEPVELHSSLREAGADPIDWTEESKWDFIQCRDTSSDMIDKRKMSAYSCGRRKRSKLPDQKSIVFLYLRTQTQTQRPSTNFNIDSPRTSETVISLRNLTPK